MAYGSDVKHIKSTIIGNNRKQIAQLPTTTKKRFVFILCYCTLIETLNSKKLPNS